MTNEEVTQHWITQECQAVGCRVVIRMPLGEQEVGPVCKWHKRGTAYNDDQISSEVDTGPALSFDEFGVDLFQAIRTASSRVQALKTAHVSLKKGKLRSAEEYVTRAEGLARELVNLLGRGTINPEDTRRVLALDAHAPAPPVLTNSWNQSYQEQKSQRQPDPSLND